MTKAEVINILKYELSQISDEERHPNILQHKDFCKTVLEELEERPTGEWVEELPSVYYCSRCRSEPFGDNLYNYCPHCGAYMMKGAKE